MTRVLKKIKTAFNRLAWESLDSPARVSGAVALGVFFGIAPFWGFQLVLALLAASALKVNRVIAGAATNISVPPLIPFILYASIRLGGSVIGSSAGPTVLIRTISLQSVKSCAAQYLVGSILLAILCALAAGGLTYAAASASNWRLACKKSS